MLYMSYPLIKDPPRKGQPLYKGHFQYPQSVHFQPPKRGSLPTRDKMASPKVSLTREVPLYSVLPLSGSMYGYDFNDFMESHCTTFAHVHVHMGTCTCTYGYIYLFL